MTPYQKYEQCMQQNQHDQALQHLQQHLRANRQHAAGFYQLGNLQRAMNLWSQALCAYLEACRLDPDQSDFQLNLGVMHQWLQQPAQAAQCYQTAWQKKNNPAILFNRAQALLLAGRYEEGWVEYEWRRQIPDYKPRFEWYPAERQWQGQPFPGQTLVVYHEQGLGDDIQFARFLPYAKALGGKVVFSTRPALIPILSTLHGIDQVVEQSEETFNSLAFRWAVPIMSLPGLCRTTLDSIPNQTPYLHVPPAYQTKWQTLLAPYAQQPGKKRIGIVWACNPIDILGQLRSCPFPQLASLFALPETQWFSLQKGPAVVDIQNSTAAQSQVIDLTPHLDDFADTAALIDQLDLVISIDTSVAHLAGALGKPVWLLLPYANEWRWLLRRSDSPWYPTFRLFRQPLPGDWNAILEQVKQELAHINPPAR